LLTRFGTLQGYVTFEILATLNNTYFFQNPLQISCMLLLSS
jgi:hypothetical protein